MDGTRTGEGDCHNALVDLDRGFRSTKIGERYQAVATLPDFLRNYPFPLFVNNAFLKVAELFKNGNNLLRMAIVRAVERSAQALEGVISKDEMARRLLVVSHSNDPVARAVTLRLMGALAPIFGEMKQVHHLIGSSLDSRDEVELHAAILAAQRFAVHSREFARSIFEKIRPLLGGVETIISRKQQFLLIVQHFGSDAETAAKAFRFLESELFPDSSSQRLLCLILNVLTRLSQNSVFILPNQVSLLLKAVKGDYARNVKNVAVKNLKILAKSSAHLWSFENVQDMISVGLDPSLSSLGRIAGLETLIALTRSPSAPLWLPRLGSSLAKKCLEIEESSQRIRLLVAELVIHIVTQNFALDTAPELKNECQQVCSRLLLSLLLGDSWEVEERFCFELLRVARLFTAIESSPRTVIAGIIMDRAPKTSSIANGKAMLITLLWVAERDSNLGQEIGEWAAENLKQLVDFSPIITSKLLFRVEACPLEISKVVDLVELIEEVSTNGWQLLVFARSALENGWPSAASKLFHTISTLGLSQLSGNYVKGMLSISQAELMLQDNDCEEKTESLCENLDESCRLYNKGQISLEMTRANGDVKLAEFPLSFLRARLKFLKAARNFLLSLNAIRAFPHLAPSQDPSSPPKAQLISQVSSGARVFRESVAAWKALEAECFDADDESLRFLRSQSSLSSLLQTALHATLGGKIQENVLPGVSAKDGTSQELKKNYLLLSGIESDPGGITMKKLFLVETAITNMIRAPFRFPTFFFRSTQETRVQLLLSPAPQTSGVVVAITGHQIVVKVEGVISHGGPRPKSLRSVSEVILTVRTEQSASSTEDGKSGSGSRVMTKKLRPHNNYFTAEFLVVFHQPGTVVVETSLIDDQTERIWTTRATASLKIAVVS